MYGDMDFAAFGGCCNRNAAASAPPITTATAMPIIKRLESRSSATGVGCPKLLMKRIVGCCFSLVDFHPSSVSLCPEPALSGAEGLLGLSRGQQPSRVVVIDLFQYPITQPESIQAPVIRELINLIEVLVQRFQDAKRDPVHRLVVAHVGPVHQPVGMLLVERRGKAWDRRRLC